MAIESKPSNPGVKFPPPFLFLLGLAVAWLMETRVVRIRLVGEAASGRPLELLGAALLAGGLLLLFWGLLTFARVKTGIIPIRSATRIVDHGPYRFTRNPMYAGIALAYFGGALMVNSGWALLLLPVVMLGIYHLVIKREEYYLLAAFPNEYRDYRKRVRRWM